MAKKRGVFLNGLCLLGEVCTCELGLFGHAVQTDWSSAMIEVLLCCLAAFAKRVVLAAPWSWFGVVLHEPGVSKQEWYCWMIFDSVSSTGIACLALCQKLSRSLYADDVHCY